MNSTKLMMTFLIGVLGLLGAGWYSGNTIWAQSAATALDRSAASPSDYLIGPGDTVDVRIFKQPEMSGRFRVSEQGNLNLPFVGVVQAAGQTETELTGVIREKLTRYLKQPELSVTVSEFLSQSVTVVGAVKTTGKYPLRRPERILDVLGMAGGLTETAGKSIQLLRRSPMASSEGALSSEAVELVTIQLADLLTGRPEYNQPLVNGDLISVPEADTIYVTGNVVKPGSFTPRENVTLSQAIALAGGLTPTAQASNISVFRGIPGATARQELVFKLRDIETRKVADPVLLANDVVYIRGSESRSIGYAFLRAITTGFGTAAGYAIFR